MDSFELKPRWYPATTGRCHTMSTLTPGEQLRQIGDRPKMKTPEIQFHNELTDTAAIELQDEDFPGDHTFTAIGVLTVKDPEPSKGYVLLVVVDGLTRSVDLGDTVQEAKDVLADWDTIENLLGID